MKKKLTSRKLWALITAVVISALTAFRADGETVQSIVGIIGAVGACVSYIFAEAKIDAKGVQTGSDNSGDDNNKIGY